MSIYPEFAPCPFCGSSDVGYAYRLHPDGHEICTISCTECGACGPFRAYTSEADDDESVSAWNSRSDIDLTFTR